MKKPGGVEESNRTIERAAHAEIRLANTRRGELEGERRISWNVRRAGRRPAAGQGATD
jgi:hypothetical protein